MPINHIVLLNTGDADDAAVDAMIDAIKSLEATFADEGLLKLTCGRNFSERSDGFTVGAGIHFDTADSLAAYQVDPRHREVVDTYIKPICTKVIACDYEY